MMDRALIEDIFRQEGQSIVFGANQPLFLNDRQDVFLVGEGGVDIFAVLRSDGKSVGPRTHLYRVEKQHIFWGLGRIHAQDALGLLAVPGIGAKVLTLPIAHYCALLAETNHTESAGFLLSAWIEGIATGVADRLVSKDIAGLKPGTISLDPGNAVRPAADIVWVFHQAGSSTFMGYEDRVIDADAQFIPLAGAMWLQAREPTTLIAVTLADYIKDHPDLPDLVRFHELILAFVSSVVKYRADAEEDRWHRQIRNERQLLQNTMHDIASLMATDKGETELSVPAGEDPLLSACRLVGNAYGLAVRSPPTQGEQDISARLEAMARASRIRVRRVLLTGQWWRTDHGPLLGFSSESQRPLALLQDKVLHTRLYDPQDRSSREVNAALAGQVAPFAFQFYRPLPDKPVSAGILARFVSGRIRAEIRNVLFLGVLIALLSLMIPIGTGIVFNTIIPEAARGQMVQLAACLFACTLGIALLEAAKGLALLRIETKVDADTQAAIMDRLLLLPVSFFRKFTAGDLAQRTLGVAAIREVVSLFTIQSGVAGLFAVTSLSVMFWYDVALACVASIFVGTGAILIFLLNLMQIKRIRQMTEIEGGITGMILQFISGISKLRVAGAENLAFSRWAHDFSRQRRFAYRAGVLFNIQTTFNAVFPAMGLLLLFAWISENHTDLRTGDFLAFLSAYTNVQAGVFQLFAAFASVLKALPLFERMAPIFQAIPEIDETKTSPGELYGHLEIRGITFRYYQDGPEILSDVSLTIQPGQFIALVGGSGSGKSTLLRLLLGFEQPQAGGIYYDGKDIAALDCREVRRQIGVVLQGGSVWPGSILDNIRGAANLPLDDVWEAARMAGLDEDIREMPMGLHTFLTPGGGSLSGGQRQRLLIARALIRKPRILFFDEATSALDNRTQETVSLSLGQLQATRIVIAHRLSTVIQADCIHVLEKGRIIESGTYDVLMRQEGAFAALVKRQIV